MYIPSTNPPLFQVKELIKALFDKANRNLIVGVSGRSGSGKSTFASQLMTALVADSVNTKIFCIDYFVFPSKIRDVNPDPGVARYYDSYDFKALFSEVILPLKTNLEMNKDILILNRDKDIQEKQRISIQGPAIILIEGVQIFRKKFVHLFDYKIWIHVSLEKGLKRIMYRTGHFDNNLSTDCRKKRYIENSNAAHEIYITLDKPDQNSDLILNGSLPI